MEATQGRGKTGRDSMIRRILVAIAPISVCALVVSAYFGWKYLTRSPEVLFVADSNVFNTTFYNDGRSVVVISHRGTCSFLDVASRRVLQTLRLSDHGPIFACVPSKVKFSSDGRHVIVMEATGKTHVLCFSTRSWSFLGTISPYGRGREDASDICVHPRKSEFVLIDRHGNLEKYVLNETSFERAAVRKMVALQEHDIPSQGCSFKLTYVDDGHRLAVLIPQISVVICDERDLTPIRNIEAASGVGPGAHPESAELPPAQWSAGAITMSDSSTLLLVSSFPGNVGVIGIDEDDPTRLRSEVSWDWMRICGKLVFSINDHGEVFQFDMTSKRLVSLGWACKRDSEWRGISYSFDVSQDATRIVASKDNQVLIYDICKTDSSTK